MTYYRDYKCDICVAEPNGRVESLIQDNYHLSVVPALLCNSVPEQERSIRGENHVLPSC